MGGKSSGFVIVDDHSRFTWVYFLAHKDEALHTFIRHCKKVQNEKSLTLINVRSDHSGEFENHGFESFNNESFLIATDVNDSWLYRRLGHASMKTLSKLVKNDLVIGLPKLNFNKDKI